MQDDAYRIFPLGDSALTVEFGNTIAVDLNKKAIALAAHFEHAPFPGFIESVPAYASATIFYDIVAVRSKFPEFQTAFDAVSSLVIKALNQTSVTDEETNRYLEITVDFGRNFALDLDFIAENRSMSPKEFIEIFMSTVYRVFMIGFLPGFAYMGEVDERIATPRKETPRLKVPKGSVGIAGRQTGIYSLESPGGWQIIGRTDVAMFAPDAKDPTYLRPGDEVRFVSAK